MDIHVIRTAESGDSHSHRSLRRKKIIKKSLHHPEAPDEKENRPQRPPADGHDHVDRVA